MISRRSFLKIAGAGAAALTAGFGAGKLFSSSANKRYSLHAFVPSDKTALQDILLSFRKYSPSSNAIVTAPGEWKKFIEESLSAPGNFSNSSFIVKLEKINSAVKSDILLSDERTFIYNPAEDFTGSFNAIRTKLSGRDAEYLLSLEYTEQPLFSFGTKHLVIENESGIVDKIDISKTYRDIEVKGNVGITIVKTGNGSASVTKSCCKNKLCSLHNAIAHDGSLIACAPNRVLLRIERS